MGKPYLILKVLKLVREGESVVIVDAFAVAIVVEENFVVVSLAVKLGVGVPRDIVLLVLDVLAGSVPALLHLGVTEAALFELSSRPDDWLHAKLVERIRLAKVQNIELDFRLFVLLKDYLEIVPLGVTLGIEIVLQPQIVLDVVHLCGFAEVAAFKSGIEDQKIVLLWNIHCVLRLVVVSLH